MPFRTSKRRGPKQGKATKRREQPPLGSFPSASPPEKKNGHDTSWTHSESSMDEERLAPLLSIETSPRQQHPQNRSDDVSSIHVGESVSNGLSNKRRSKQPSIGRGRPPPRGGGSSSIHAGLQSVVHPTDLNASQELDLLLDTISLAEKSEKENKEKNKKGKYCLGKGSQRSKERQKSRNRSPNEKDPYNPEECAFRAHDSDASAEALISFVSGLTMSPCALTSSTIGLSLLTASPPEDAWTHPPARMVQESIDRHVRVCLDSYQPPDKDAGAACTGNTLSLPVDVDDVSFLKTDREAVHEVALLHISEGEPQKALEIVRALLESQRTNRVAEQSEIADTKSKLAILSLMTENREDAWTYTTSALQTHKKGARPVHTTLATMELGLVCLGMEKLKRALQCWREALQLACMTLGYDHFQVAVLLGNLGCLHYYIGNFPASLTAFEESLGLQRQILRSNSQCANVEMPLFQMATTMGNLALILAQRKNYESATSLMEEGLAIQESVLAGTDSVKVVSEKYLELFTQLRNAAESVVGGKSTGRDSSSKKSFEMLPLPPSIFGDSDGIPRRHDGSKHRHFSSRSVATSGEEDPSYDCILLGSLVKPAIARQRVHSTVVQSLESAARRQPILMGFTDDDGATIPSTVASRKKQSIPVDLDGEAVINAEFHLEEINLQALDHLSRNEFKDALDLFESALRSHKEKYGDVHHLVGTGLHNCGIVHMVAQQYIQGKLCFQEAVSVRTAALGDTHPDVAASKFKIGMIQMAAGDYECALSTFMDIIFQLQMNMSTYGFAPEAKMLNNVGVCLFEMDRDLDAFQSFFKAYQIQRGLINDSSNCTSAERALASTLSNLAFIYAKQGQYSDSLGAYQEAMSILKRFHPIDSPIVVMVEENLAHVRAYGSAEEQKARWHAQSEVFASCTHLERDGGRNARKVKSCGQSNMNACFSPMAP